MPRPAAQGFLPCFQYYCFGKYPIADLYGNRVYLDKLKKLLVSALDVQSLIELRTKHGIGREIRPIRPGDAESERIIEDAGYPHQLYRIDYGDTPFRIVFGIQPCPKLIHIVMIDTKHKTYSGKNRR